MQRILYHRADLHASGAPEAIVLGIPGYAQLTGSGHWMRDAIFSKDGRSMFVSVDSEKRTIHATNVVTSIKPQR